eukprot:TRINITY_DN19625_c0_g1_i1.p1 TRINITY_DN19625_c0_g1~~TRINITY_DN19625_c0_g1_i1.p1  ORF type:complete len:660 (-),score=126.72 TRINITY_DN19625_c0_g1_i1:96-2075(-)
MPLPPEVVDCLREVRHALSSAETAMEMAVKARDGKVMEAQHAHRESERATKLAEAEVDNLKALYSAANSRILKLELKLEGKREEVDQLMHQLDGIVDPVPKSPMLALPQPHREDGMGGGRGERDPRHPRSHERNRERDRARRRGHGVAGDNAVGNDRDRSRDRQRERRSGGSFGEGSGSGRQTSANKGGSAGSGTGGDANRRSCRSDSRKRVHGATGREVVRATPESIGAALPSSPRLAGSAEDPNAIVGDSRGGYMVADGADAEARAAAAAAATAAADAVATSRGGGIVAPAGGGTALDRTSNANELAVAVPVADNVTVVSTSGDLGFGGAIVGAICDADGGRRRDRRSRSGSRSSRSDSGSSSSRSNASMDHDHQDQQQLSTRFANDQDKQSQQYPQQQPSHAQLPPMDSMQQSQMPTQPPPTQPQEQDERPRRDHDGPLDSLNGDGDQRRGGGVPGGGSGGGDTRQAGNPETRLRASSPPRGRREDSRSSGGSFSVSPASRRGGVGRSRRRSRSRSLRSSRSRPPPQRHRSHSGRSRSDSRSASRRGSHTASWHRQGNHSRGGHYERRGSDHKSGKGGDKGKGSTKGKADRDVPLCISYVMGNCQWSANCRDRHPDPENCRAAKETLLSKPCRFGSQCKRRDCIFKHPARSPRRSS